MTLLKAFVSHSFLEVDEPVVRKFVALLEQVAANNPSFSWDHAIRAEPRSISEKVEEVLEGKNVFIAICSEREQVCNADLLKKWPLLGNLVRAGDLNWKTSDWIVQEIGLARGRGCKIILLLENDVRNPAPLLADIQYIRFDRGRPEGSFTELLAMIASLSPHPENTPTSVASPIASRPPPTENDPGNDDRSERPQSDWKVIDYRRALTRAIGMKAAPQMQSKRYMRRF